MMGGLRYGAAPSAEAPRSTDPGGCGLAVLLLTLGMLFAASLAFFILMRVRAVGWPPPGTPRLPALFWLSSGLLIVCSLTMHGALQAARRARLGELRSYLAASLVLGLAFLANQLVCWLPLLHAGVSTQTNLFMLAFLMLAVLHGLHVIGGLLPLGACMSALAGGRFSARTAATVQHLATYWHFLDAVWLVIFITLLIAL
jgi:cytochrome c oxidase subunit III